MKNFQEQNKVMTTLFTYTGNDNELTLHSQQLHKHTLQLSYYQIYQLQDDKKLAFSFDLQYLSATKTQKWCESHAIW